MSFFKKINAREIPSVDLVKFIMAIFVVAIHTHPYTCIENANLSFFVQKLISLSVPFFFVASGFFLWRKIDDTNTEKLLILKKWILRLVKLYIIWTFIYLPFTIYGDVIDGLSPLKALLVFIRNLLFTGENMYSWPLWYLLAMIVAGIMMYIMVYFHFKKSTMYIIALLALFSGIILDKYNGVSVFSELYFRLFHTTRNGIFVGFPYLMIGAYIASHGIITKRNILFSFIILSFTMDLYGLTITRYLIAYQLFSIIIGLNIKGNPTLFKFFRLSSVVIYLLHMILVGGINLLDIDLSPLLLFILVTLVSISLSILVFANNNQRITKLLFG